MSSVASRTQNRGGQSVVLSSDSDNDSEDLQTLARRVSGVRARKQAAAASGAPMPAGSQQQPSIASPGSRGRKRGKAQQAPPEASRQPAARRQRNQQQQPQRDEAGPSRAGPAHLWHSQLRQEVQQAVVDLTASDSDDDLIIVDARGPSRQAGGRQSGGNDAAIGGRSAAAAGPLLRNGVPLVALRTPVRAPPAPSVVTSPRGPTCAVCMEKLREPSCGPCGHIFCKACLTESIKKLKKCPTCRRGFQVRQIHRVFLPDDS